MRTPTSRLTRLALAALAVPLATGAGWPEDPVPETIPLESEATAETGFNAEGIVTRGRTAYAGSLATGTIVAADLVTGEVRTVVDEGPGPAVGLDLDRRGTRLFVAGGAAGDLRVYDTRTGDELARFEDVGEFVNDVVVTRRAAYATDSNRAALIEVPLGRHGAIGEPREIALGGDFELAGGEFNANGIVGATGGRALIVAQSNVPDEEGSALHLVDPRTGEADRIEVRDGRLENADGLVRFGRTLFVVENRSNDVAVVRLDRGLRSGRVLGVLTDPDFNVPTTADLALGALYAVNGQFGQPDDTTWEIVRVDRGIEPEPGADQG